jgi:hypothetical protein
MTVLAAGTACAEEAFMKAPKVIVGPNAEYVGYTRKFQGIPSVALSPKGRLWATWYGGPGKGEDGTNYVMVATSGDDGKTWTDTVLVIDPDGSKGPVRAFDPEMWLDPTGRLWVFWAQGQGHDGSVAGVWGMTTDQPERADAAWSEPLRLTDGIMMCKPTVLSSGEWLLPASTWRKTDNSAKAVVSTDQGKTWNVRGGCQVPEKVRAYDEHMIVEKKDGTLWLLARTKYGIGESFSTDGGKTWPDLTPSTIAHTSSRFFIRRLDSGNLLLVKHGPIGKQTGRSQLTAFVSEDDGKTWPHHLMLDERKGVSYPDGVEAKDGTIYIIYDRNRSRDREILLARFNEADVRRGSLVSENSALRLLVNAAGAPGEN